jgi:hypothetical protein
VVTVRKLEFENDAFGFADKVIEKCALFPFVLTFLRCSVQRTCIFP